MRRLAPAVARSGPIKGDQAWRLTDRVERPGPGGRSGVAIGVAGLCLRRISVEDESESGAQPIRRVQQPQAPVLSDETCGYQGVGAWLHCAGCISHIGLDSRLTLIACHVWARPSPAARSRRLTRATVFGLKPLSFREMPSAFAFGSCCTVGATADAAQRNTAAARLQFSLRDGDYLFRIERTCAPRSGLQAPTSRGDTAECVQCLQVNVPPTANAAAS